MSREKGFKGLMIQGTGSGVGKSLIVAGLCRYLSDQFGWRVRPFKPQNMSNNAAVCSDGGEIGRSTALQALACRCDPISAMNPILLKPQAGHQAQIIICGQAKGIVDARTYRQSIACLWPAVMEAFSQVGRDSDCVIVEGAGSPAEINLAGPDIANMAFAQEANLPVLLVSDIDRGGSLASIVGTWTLLQGRGQKRLIGYIINKFRGDRTLLEPAWPIIKHHTGLQCFGVVPWYDDLHHLPAEDSLDMDRSAGQHTESKGNTQITIGVIRLPHMANFDDCDPLQFDPRVAWRVLDTRPPWPDCDVIIIPGSKAVVYDMEVLRAHGGASALRHHAQAGGHVLGLCGGYQMLGQLIEDPQRREGGHQKVKGLGLLPLTTVIEGNKVLRLGCYRYWRDGAVVEGYEIHMGRTEGKGDHQPMFTVAGDDSRHGLSPKLGARTSDGRIEGSYIHGIFARDDFRNRWLESKGCQPGSSFSYTDTVEATIKRWSQIVGQSVDVKRLLGLL